MFALPDKQQVERRVGWPCLDKAQPVLLWHLAADRKGERAGRQAIELRTGLVGLEYAYCNWHHANVNVRPRASENLSCSELRCAHDDCGLPKGDSAHVPLES